MLATTTSLFSVLEGETKMGVSAGGVDSTWVCTRDGSDLTFASLWVDVGIEFRCSDIYI
jgi:hypothetical protein